MKTVTVKKNQSVYDVALEQYGTTEAVGELMTNNPDMRNDPAALGACDIDPQSAGETLYTDVALDPGTMLHIDTDSRLSSPMITKQLQNDITTYEHGTDN